MSAPGKSCDCCRVKPATRLLVRAELGGDGARMRACDTCMPDGEWMPMGLDADAMAKEYDAKEANR